MLHLVNYSFSDPGEASRCLSRLGDGDRLLFLGNGVFSVIRTSVSAAEIAAQSNRIEIFALRNDLAVRGIAADTLVSAVRLVDYSGFVRLARDHGPVQSWFK